MQLQQGALKFFSCTTGTPIQEATARHSCEIHPQEKQTASTIDKYLICQEERNEKRINTKPVEPPSAPMSL
jgi:hypothetical protein